MNLDRFQEGPDMHFAGGFRDLPGSDRPYEVHEESPASRGERKPCECASQASIIHATIGPPLADPDDNHGGANVPASISAGVPKAPRSGSGASATPGPSCPRCQSWRVHEMLYGDLKICLKCGLQFD